MGTSTARGAWDVLLCYPHHPCRREVTNWYDSTSPCKATQMTKILFASGLSGLGAELRCLHTPTGWPLVCLSAWPYVQAIQSQPARQNEQKTTPIYLQVFRLTWPNASALSRGGMSGRKCWVQEALVWAAASPGERRHLGQIEQSPWAHVSPHRRCSSMHLPPNPPLSPQDHHTSTKQMSFQIRLLTGSNNPHQERKNKPFSFFIQMDGEMVLLTLSEEWCCCF